MLFAWERIPIKLLHSAAIEISTRHSQQKSAQLSMMKGSHPMEKIAVAETQTDGLEVLETREWLDSLDYVLSQGGPDRAARVNLPFTATTPYTNTISAIQQPPFPGSQEMERRIKSLVRWNALAMVVRANKLQEGIGGHISTFASAATLYEVAFNHFLHART